MSYYNLAQLVIRVQFVIKDCGKWVFEHGSRLLKRDAMQAWNVHAWPTLYVLDAEGRIRFKSRGSPGDATLDQWVNTLLAEIGETAQN